MALSKTFLVWTTWPIRLWTVGGPSEAKTTQLTICLNNHTAGHKTQLSYCTCNHSVLQTLRRAIADKCVTLWSYLSEDFNESVHGLKVSALILLHIYSNRLPSGSPSIWLEKLILHPLTIECSILIFAMVTQCYIKVQRSTPHPLRW